MSWKENRVLFSWYSIDGFTGFGGSALFDSFAAIAALEKVVHLAQKYADERYSRYQIILRKCHPLVADASLQNILIK